MHESAYRRLAIELFDRLHLRSRPDYESGLREYLGRPSDYVPSPRQLENFDRIYAERALTGHELPPEFISAINNAIQQAKASSQMQEDRSKPNRRLSKRPVRLRVGRRT